MTRAPRPRAFPLILTLLAATACGGGGGGGNDPPSVTILAAEEFDGVVDVSGFIAFNPSSSAAHTGDLEASYRPGYEMRQLYAFHLGALSAGARLVRAELRLWQARVEGSPYEKNGNVIVDHVDYIPDPGPDSFDAQTLSRDIGTLSTSAALGLRTLDVTDAVRADLAVGRPWSQFRLRFWQPIVLPILDHANDFVRFTTAEGTTEGDLPTLVLFYEP